MRSIAAKLQAAALAFFFSSSLAAPLSVRTLHEKRSFSENSPWRQSSRVAGDSIVPLRIGLTQSNLEHGAFHLESIADPTSPNYGQHLTADEVHSLFAPAESTVDAVRNWLLDAGFKADEIVHSDNKGWLALDVPASSVESLLGTYIHEYEHDATGSLRLGCEEYHVPAHLAEHIDYVTPGVKLSAMVTRRSNFVGKRSIETVKAASAVLQPRSNEALPKSLRNCSNEVTPDCIRALYSLPKPTEADQANAPAFFEQGDYYAQKDLDGFFAKYAPQIKAGTGPVLRLIDGAVDPSQNATLEPITGEQEGDVEVAFGLVYPTIPIVYQVDDPYYAQYELQTYNLFNTFLDALDGSYCNYTAYGITGDSWRDPTYPDPQKGGYKGKLQCGVFKPATVISISYGEAEYDIPIRYDKRQCNEWMKLSLQGHTILTASGDFGVAGIPNDGSKRGPGKGAPNGCLPGPDQAPRAKNARVFQPDYLSSCPYITSVSATMIPKNGSVTDGEVGAYVLFPGNQTYSGSGGFSNYFPRPKFQEWAVNEYFAKHDPGYKYYTINANVTNIGENGGLYNRAGRAFPDVSANGAYLGLDLGGQTGPIGFGTSFASPIWASTISLINTARSKAGKKTVGWINPTLYANPSAMNDITSGTNPGCGTQGFEAVEGWDPNTGLGTPNYEKLLKVFMALP